jgi:hypothetical protein
VVSWKTTLALLLDSQRNDDRANDDGGWNGEPTAMIERHYSKLTATLAADRLA